MAYTTCVVRTALNPSTGEATAVRAANRVTAALIPAQSDFFIVISLVMAGRTSFRLVVVLLIVVVALLVIVVMPLLVVVIAPLLVFVVVVPHLIVIISQDGRCGHCERCGC